MIGASRALIGEDSDLRHQQRQMRTDGIGHAWGYRNYDVKDHSRNFFPAGFLLGGEELHNNHHADPKSARFRRRWFEFDVGWIYIKIMSWFRLARVIHAARWVPEPSSTAAP